MKHQLWILFSVAFIGTFVSARQCNAQGVYAADQGQYFGAGSVGSNEQLFSYDDQERWKHGYIKIMPYYHGFHSFRPYNYHHVFGQSTTAQGFGMSPVMPYSQQFWHRYERMADLSQGNHEPVFPSAPPIKKDDHFPKPINEAALPGRPGAQLMSPGQNLPTTGPRPYSEIPRPQRNSSQLFQPDNQSALGGAISVAPVQYQNSNPAQASSQSVQTPGSFQGPSLPAPSFRR